MFVEDVKSFSNITQLLGELKEMVSKSGSSSLITPEFLTQKFCLFETTLQKELAPLSQLISLLPTNAPPVVTWVQGGERRPVSKGEGASGRTKEEVKVVGKVFASHVPTSKPTPTFAKADPVIAIVTTTRLVTKGIVIGTTGEGSSSKPILTTTNQDREKGIVVEKSKEERKIEVEVEMEKQRQI